MISQLSAYGVLWILFSLLVYAVAREGGWRGSVIVHVAIALLIVALDLRWIANNGLRPPENPLGITIAITLRVLMVNAVLLPLSLIAILLRRHGSRPVATRGL